MMNFAAGLASGILGALGLGGGSVLLLYLALVTGTDQLVAQGINLLFFLPVGAFSLWQHHRHGLVRWDLVLPALLPGLVGVWGGSLLAGYIGGEGLSKLFGVLLIVLGLRELFSSKKSDDHH